MVKDLTGKRFGRLIVLEFVGVNHHGNAVWLCLCKCGALKKVLGNNLQRTATKSCGCWHREQAAAKQFKHGHNRRGNTSPEYKSWESMIQRCTNPNYKFYEYYGGANPPVKVCERWLKFENFLADMGPRPKGTSLGRFVDLGDYEPGNVYWASRAEQGLDRMNKFHLLKWAAERDAVTPEQRAA